MIRNASTVIGFTKLSLMIIKAGLLVLDLSKTIRMSEYQQFYSDSQHLQNSVYKFMLKYLSKEPINVKSESNVVFKEEIQLLEDIKYLVEVSQSESIDPLHQQLINRSLFLTQSYLTIPSPKNNIIIMKPQMRSSKRAKKRCFNIASSQLNVSTSSTQLLMVY